MESLLGTITELFASIQKIPVEQVDSTVDIFQVYGVNSVRAVKLLSMLEVELDIEFPEEEMHKIRTLQDVRGQAERLLTGCTPAASEA